MQDFIAAYGIWLLAALAVAIVLVFLLKGKGKTPTASKAAVPLDAPPAPAPAPPPPAAAPAPAAAGGEPDNLTQLKGVGPKVNAILNGLGITRFEQIATWTDEDIARVDPHLGNFAGRIVRDQWVDQASYLARGDQAGFEARYGKL